MRIIYLSGAHMTQINGAPGV